MSRNIRSTNLRFNLDKDIQHKAWHYLQTMDRKIFKSYNHVIALSVVEYFERHYQKEDDPYFETRQREEKFVNQIVSAVEKAMEKALPLFLAGWLSGIGEGQPTNAMPHEEKTFGKISTGAKQEDASADVDWDFLGE